MKPRIVFASLIVLFLMTACAPFPVAIPCADGRAGAG